MKSYAPFFCAAAASSASARSLALFFRGRVSTGGLFLASASASASRAAFIASRCRLPGFPFFFSFACSFPSPSSSTFLARFRWRCLPPASFFLPPGAAFFFESFFSNDSCTYPPSGTSESEPPPESSEESRSASR